MSLSVTLSLLCRIRCKAVLETLYCDRASLSVIHRQAVRIESSGTWMTAI